MNQKSDHWAVAIPMAILLAVAIGVSSASDADMARSGWGQARIEALLAAAQRYQCDQPPEVLYQAVSSSGKIVASDYAQAEKSFHDCRAAHGIQARARIP